jgi:hypothetical protein
LNFTTRSLPLLPRAAGPSQRNLGHETISGPRLQDYRIAPGQILQQREQRDGTVTA